MIFVVTLPDLGWDCVVGIYEADSEQQIEEYLISDGVDKEYIKEYVISRQTITKLN